MEETKANPADQQPQSDKAQPSPDTQSEVAAQLNKFSENVNALLKSVLDPEQRKKIEKQIAASLEQLNKQLSKTIEQVKVDAAIKQARSQIEEAWATMHGPQILKEMKAGLADSIKAVNKELSKVSAKPPAVEVKPAEEAKAAVEAVAAKTEAAIDAVAAKVEDIKPPKA